MHKGAPGASPGLCKVGLLFRAVISCPRAKALTLALCGTWGPLSGQLQCLQCGTNCPLPPELSQLPRSCPPTREIRKRPPWCVCIGGVSLCSHSTPASCPWHQKPKPHRPPPGGRSRPWARAQALGSALTALTPPRPSVPCTGGPASGPGRWPPTCGRKGGHCAASCPRAVPLGALLPPQKPRGKGEPCQQQELSGSRSLVMQQKLIKCLPCARRGAGVCKNRCVLKTNQPIKQNPNKGRTIMLVSALGVPSTGGGPALDKGAFQAEVCPAKFLC